MKGEHQKIDHFQLMQSRYVKMFSSQMNFLFTLLTILLKSRTDVEQKRASKLEAFIVGGKYATIQDFPHSALLAIHCRKKSFEDFTCGASILNQWILLTAAHCFHGCKTDTKILVLVGDRIKMKGTYYSISKFAGHADYQGEQMKNDIAVALASKPLVFSSTVKRVQLSPVGIYNEPALVAGWGVTDVIIDILLTLNFMVENSIITNIAKLFMLYTSPGGIRDRHGVLKVDAPDSVDAKAVLLCFAAFELGFPLRYPKFK